MVHFVGAGPGAADLITLRGASLLKEADTVIYAGSLVNPELLKFCREDCKIWNSAEMTLEEILRIMKESEKGGKMTVRLHTGDPSIYGAIREQMKGLDEAGIEYQVTPGVSSFNAAAAELNAEFTLPDVSQSVILTRMQGRTDVPEREKMSALSKHGASMAIFLSAGLVSELQQELLKGAYRENTPAAIIYKASWPEQHIVHCTVGTLANAAKENRISHTAMILVGDFLDAPFSRSRLYDPDFSTAFREGKREA